MTTISPVLPFVLALALCPLLSGAARRVAAAAAGRKGPPLWGGYRELAVAAKGNGVPERDVDWIAKAGPIAALAGSLAAAVVLPMGAGRAVFFFSGDIILGTGAFVMAQAFLLLSVIHSGSAAEMPAAGREVIHGVLIWPGMLLAATGMARATGQTNLSGIILARSMAPSDEVLPFLCAGLAMLLAAIAEKARDWADDGADSVKPSPPRTSMPSGKGADWMLVCFGADLKLWVFGALAVGFATPVAPGYGFGLFLAGMVVFAVLTGIGVGVLVRRWKIGTLPLLAAALIAAVLSFATAGGVST